MRYSQLEPSSRWKKYVECYWFLSAPAEKTGWHPIVPDGRMEWVFHLGDPFLRQYPDGTRETQPLWLIVGQMREPVVVAPTGKTLVAGIHFKPAGTMPFLHNSPRKWTGRITEFSIVEDHFKMNLKQAFAEVESETEIRELLESLLESTHSEEWDTSGAVLQILDQLAVRPNSSLSEILQHVGISKRHAQRMFLEQVGLNLKEFQRIQRFQKVFQSWQNHEEWVSAAIECGYYDQSHLIRDFKQFAGLPPVDFQRAKNEITEALKLHRRIHLT